MQVLSAHTYTEITTRLNLTVITTVTEINTICINLKSTYVLFSGHLFPVTYSNKTKSILVWKKEKHIGSKIQVQSQLNSS